MKIQILGNYLFHLIPMVLLPALVYLDDPAIPLANLMKISFLVPLLLLAIRGLGTYFPKENFARRSAIHVAEHCLLHGLLFAGAMALVVGLSSANPEPDLGRMLRQFGITTAVWFVLGFPMALYEQRRQNSLDK